MSKETIHIKQEVWNQIQSTFEYIKVKSPFYKEKLFQMSLHSKEDFFNLPFTTKDEFAQQNENFCCVPKNKIAEYVTTSGTTGKPVTIYLTKADLERLATNEADSLELTGATEDDVFQLMTTIDKQFMAGLAYYLGVQKLNGGMVRVGPGVLNMQLASILQYKPTYLIAVPSFIPRLIEFANKNGVDLNQTTVKSIVCIGEPIRDLNFDLNKLGHKIVDQWNVDLFSTYASTEMATAFTECPAHQGYHTNESLIFVEVVNELGEWAAEGEVGEIVVTTLGVEGTPLIRYKTGDLAHVYYEKCKCGRQNTRLSSIVGRKNQMIKFKGTTLFPSAIFSALNEIREVTLYQVEVIENEGDIKLNLLLPHYTNEALLEKVKETLKSTVRVLPEIKLIDDRELKDKVFNEDKRKPELIRFIDA
jgi:phenylacetate-CoA ligase